MLLISLETWVQQFDFFTWFFVYSRFRKIPSSTCVWITTTSIYVCFKFSKFSWLVSLVALTQNLECTLLLADERWFLDYQYCYSFGTSERQWVEAQVENAKQQAILMVLKSQITSDEAHIHLDLHSLRYKSLWLLVNFLCGI